MNIPEKSKGLNRSSLAYSILSITQGLIIPLFMSGQAYARDPEEIFRHASTQVLVLDILDEQGSLVSSHSAVHSGQDTAVAQCDLLEESKKLQLRVGSATISATVTHHDVARNLCLLKAQNVRGTPAKVADLATVKTGARVFAISNSLGLGISISEGIISAIREIRGETLIQYTAPIAPGSEGGGLYDEQGQLIGAIRYRKLDGQNVNFALPARSIEDIPLRAAGQADLRTWREKALQLSRASEWTALVTHAEKRIAVQRDDTEAWGRLAYAEERRKNWQAAAAAYREIIKRSQEELGPRLGLGTALLQLKDAQGALELARSLLSRFGEDPGVWFLLYEAESALSHIGPAREALEQATRLNPWNKSLQRHIGWDAFSQRDNDRALRAFRQVTQIDPADLRAWTELADAYLRVGRAARAFSTVERGLQIDPINGDALLLKGKALAGLGRRKEAIDSYKAGLQHKPANPAWGWASLAETYYALTLYPEAVEAYREAVRLAPDKFSIKSLHRS